MSLKGRIIGGLGIVNLVLFLGLIGMPGERAEAVTGADAGFFNCCQESVEGESFCCDDCCLLPAHCSSSSECSGGGAGDPLDT